mgnify:CR=1 FL=1
MKSVFLGILHFYRKYISPLKKPRCIYYPTCSSYAVEAVEKFGALKGGYLAIRRLLRCHPFCEGGIDLVPEDFSIRIIRPEKKELQIGGK